MRIIAGDARGRKLFAPSGNDTRPTADRVRESLFNIIARRIPEAYVLDLFGGSGALSIEALSRGARFAVINDISKKAYELIARNVKLVGYVDRVKLVQKDYQSAVLTLPAEPFDLVFLDPPYPMAEAYTKAPEMLKARKLLSDDALLILERDARNAFELPEGFRVCDERSYGDTVITFLSLDVGGARP
jgi:RNA methyltransferase, RsmD family